LDDIFNKTANKHFLIIFSSQSNDHCTWQEIHAQSREILQRIENYSFKRRAKH